VKNQLLTGKELTHSVIEELVTDSRTLFLIFGGRKGAMGMPTFEFYKSTSILNENRVFFRDLSQNWYHTGLAGITQDIHQTRDYIQSVIERINPQETVFVGNSMGGYAAILFSTLLNTGRVVAFSPQTFIGPRKKFMARDFRWKRATLNTYVRSALKPHYYDLGLLLQNKTCRNVVDVHVSTLDKLDMKHAGNISECRNVHIHTHDIGGHSLVRHLRDQDLLRDILTGQCSRVELN
jgi:pimeloyl-ACP methyl ester carboxylesterase